eukprot:scaffold29528_cov77-Isochrysis_galbana.AAC.2
MTRAAGATRAADAATAGLRTGSGSGSGTPQGPADWRLLRARARPSSAASASLARSERSSTAMLVRPRMATAAPWRGVRAAATGARSPPPCVKADTPAPNSSSAPAHRAREVTIGLRQPSQGRTN